MNNICFNIAEEWAFIYQETISNAPKKAPLSEPLVRMREILLKMQVVLAQHDKEKDIKKKDNLLIKYWFLKNLYGNMVNGGLN